MDTKSKILFIVFALLIAGSVAVSYYRFMVARDYIIQAEAECDPYTEACFVYVCDPAPEADGDDCTGDLEEDTWYYQRIERNAQNIPLCDPNDETCDALTCPAGEAECSYILCDDETVGEGETCNDPVAYTLAHPEEEEEGDAEAGDEEDESTEEGAEGADTGEDTAEAGSEESNDTGTSDTETADNASNAENTAAPEMIP